MKFESVDWNCDCTQYTRKRIYQVQEICTIDPIFLYPFGFEISLKKFRKKKLKKKILIKKIFSTSVILKFGGNV